MHHQGQGPVVSLDLEVDCLDFAVLVDVVDEDRDFVAHPRPLNDLACELDHLGRRDPALRREHALGGHLPLDHHDGAESGGDAGAFARARALRVHREHEGVRLAVLDPLHLDLEASARLGESRFLDEPGAPRDYVSALELDGDHLCALDDDGLLGRQAERHRVHCQLEIIEREDDAHVGDFLDALEVLWHCDGLRVRVGIDRVFAYVLELGGDPVLAPAVLQHADLDELAVHEERDVARHRVDTVLDDGASLLGLAAVGVVDVNLLHLVEHRINAELGQHVSHPRRVAHADEGAYARRARIAVQVEHPLGGVQVVAHVHIIDASLDRRHEDGWPEAVERADTVEHDVRAGHGRLEALGVFGVDLERGHIGPQRRRELTGGLVTVLGDGYLVEEAGRNKGARRDAPDAAASTQYSYL